jgi:FkbM family methyltransferase
MDKNVIFDIGVYDGSDTDYYLYSGYKIVGLEANKDLFDLLVIKYESEIKSGHVVLINKALAEDTKDRTFYINNVEKGWSSLKKDCGSKVHGGTEQVVSCTTLDELIKEYGVPHYIKIDIENYECECIAALNTLPEYISVELTDLKIIDLLHEKGYTGFQLVNTGLNWIDDDYIKVENKEHPRSGKLPEKLVDMWLTAEEIKAVYERNKEQPFDLYCKK